MLRQRNDLRITLSIGERAGSAGGRVPLERHPARVAIRAIEKTTPNRARDIKPDPRRMGVTHL
jgi:hypothetical protein